MANHIIHGLAFVALCFIAGTLVGITGQFNVHPRQKRWLIAAATGIVILAVAFS